MYVCICIYVYIYAHTQHQNSLHRAEGHTLWAIFLTLLYAIQRRANCALQLLPRNTLDHACCSMVAVE